MKLLDEVIEWLENYKKENNVQGVVLGLSGGKDSTTVAMLAKKVWGDNVVGIMMPNGVQPDIDDTKAIAKSLDLWTMNVNIGSAMTAMLDAIAIDVSDKSKTNIPPRLRMTVLYAIAQTLGYCVIGTGNASEAYIGWTTKWGDSACDLNPIGNLTKTEVCQIGIDLAKEFELDERFITKEPGDGLTGKTDEDNFGFTYEQLDAWIETAKNPPVVAEIDSTGVIDKIIAMHKASEHKRKMPPKFER